MLKEQKGKRVILNVPSLPTTGETRYIYHNTTDGFMYAWNEIDSNYNKLSNDSPITVKLSESINNGQAVYISGADGTNIIISKASNITEAKSSKTLGLLINDGVTNDHRQVITNGLHQGFDTSLATIGDPIWLGVDGDLIYGLANKPISPAHLVYIGVVTRVHATEGEIYVSIQNGFELNEIHDVLLVGGTAGQVLKLDVDGLWKNANETQSNYSETNASLPSYILNKPTVTTGVGVPIGSATIGSIYIEENILGDVLGNYIYDGAAWIQNSANQVQANWTELDTSAKSYIQNKPALANVATSGDYNSLLNKPVIPAVQIQSDYTQMDNLQLDYIKNKPDLSIYELVANKGVPGGYVPLNSSGTIDSAFLNVSGTEYKGTWNPTTNTPTLSDGTGTNGWFYYVEIDGSVDLGSGMIDFSEGNIVIYDNVSNEWKRVGGQQLITNDLDASLTDFSNPLVYYYGGLTDAGDWQVNKWDMTTNTKTIANLTNNAGTTNLATAWTNRLTLNYI